MKYSFLVLLIGISTVGCSNKDLYEYIQEENKSNCSELPESQYNECIEHTKKSYKDYDKERKQM